jgi:hypothetical protein
VKKLTLILLVFCAFTIKAQQNLVLNGSFELHNSTECFNEFIFINEYNTTLQYSIDYGNSTTLFLSKASCLACLPSFYWGGGTQEGNYMLGIIAEKRVLGSGSIFEKQGKISLELTAPLLSEQNYKLSFWIKKPQNTFYPTYCLKDLKNNYISVGISNTDDAFGSHLITSPYGDTIWQQYSIVFNTQNAEEYITVKVGVNDTIDYAVLIDNFVLVETTEPVSVQEVNSNNKQLLKIVDILGKESSPTATGLLFYIYSDGTVEKKLIIE